MTTKSAAKKTAAPAAKTAAQKAKAAPAEQAVTVETVPNEPIELTPDQQAASEGSAAEAAIAAGTDPNIAAAIEAGDAGVTHPLVLPKSAKGKGGIPDGFVKHGDNDELRATSEVLVEFIPNNVTRPSRILIAADGAVMPRALVESRIAMYADANGFKLITD